MKLRILKLQNFRCYEDDISIDFENFTALIGINDAGKSAILEALDTFINDLKLDGDDATKWSNETDISIICEFEDLPDEIIIDDKNPTTLTDEYLLNKNKRLEIHKIFNGKNKVANFEIFIFAEHPSGQSVHDLLQLNHNELKARAKELGIDLYQIDDQRKNAEIRNRIRTHKTSKLMIIERKIQVDPNKMWQSLKNYLPTFALFKSDRESTDQDPEVLDPLNAAIKEAISIKRKELDEIGSFVKENVSKIAEETLEKLKDMDPTLAQELEPRFDPFKWDRVFKAHIYDADQIPLNKRGSGVKRLILLNFFRAQAERSSRSGNVESNIIYGIEEPETCQHPKNQRILLQAFRELSETSQVVITTHTPMLARYIPCENLRYIKVDEKNREILASKSNDDELNTTISEALGILPDNNVELFICIEGVNDIAFLKNMSDMLFKEGMIELNLNEMEDSGKIIFIILGGSNLAHWTSTLKKLYRPEFHLFDRDTVPPETPKHQNEADNINNDPNGNRRAIITQKLEIENYIHIDTIIKAYEDDGTNITASTNFNSFDDVPHLLAQDIHNSASDKPWNQLNIEDIKKKESKVKRMLCNRASKYMNREMLLEIDPNNEVINWFTEMKDLIDQYSE